MNKSVVFLLVLSTLLFFNGCRESFNNDNSNEITQLSLNNAAAGTLGVAQNEVFELSVTTSGWVEIKLSVSSGKANLIVSKSNSQGTASQLLNEDRGLGDKNLLTHIGNLESITVQVTALEDNTSYQVVASPSLEKSSLPYQLHQYGCTACHGSEVDAIAPSWKSISQKYLDDLDGPSVLLNSILLGGNSVWADVTGGILMPSYNGLIDETEISSLVDFILNDFSVAVLPQDIQVVSKSSSIEPLIFEFSPSVSGTYNFLLTSDDSPASIKLSNSKNLSIGVLSEYENENKKIINANLTRGEIYFVTVSTTDESIFTILAKQIGHDTITMPALAKASGCTACHEINRKIVGPAWGDVAKRYAGDVNAVDNLIAKVKSGGKGNWTEVTKGVPMPPYSPRVSDADIETLVTFILTLETAN